MKAIGLGRDRRFPLGAVLGGIAVLACLVVGVAGLDRLPVQLCVFKAVTGLPCLTCGTTRALGRLYALDLPGAFAMNPLASTGALALMLWGLSDLALLGSHRFLTVHLTGWAARSARVGAVVLVLANWAYLLAVRR